MSPESPRSRFAGALQYLFLSIFAGLGIVVAVAIAVDWLQGVDTWSWERATCAIESSEVVDRSESDDFVLRVTYSYAWRGERFEGDGYRHSDQGVGSIAEAERLASRYAAGAEVPCWVDPDEPTSAWLERANLWAGLWIFVPLLFVGVGLGGILLLRRVHSVVDDAETGDVRTAKKARASKPVRAGVIATVLFGAFFLFGLGFLVPFFVWPSLRVMEARSWRATPCEILSSHVASHSGDDSVTYSVEVLYRYEVDGREHRSDRYTFLGGSSGGYESKAEIVAGLPEGSEVTCWVNPEDPYDAVVERGFTAEYLFGLIPALFAAIGLGGLIATFVGTRAVRKDTSKPTWRPVVESRDTMGPVSLEPERGPLGKLGCSIALALLWNGFLSIFVWVFVKDWMAGNRDWFLALFLTPFVLIGLLLLAGIPYSLLALGNPRPRVRLARRAIPAGDSAQIAWSFDGWASRLRGLKLWLECSRTTVETIVHDRGQSTSTETEVIATIEIAERRAPRPLAQGSESFTVPDDALPTSRGEEAIQWKLKLQGEIAWWPDVIEEYEIVVLPADGAE